MFDFIAGFIIGGASATIVWSLWYVNRLPQTPVIEGALAQPFDEPQAYKDAQPDRYFKLVQQDSISYPYLHKDGEVLHLPRKKFMLRFVRMQFVSREECWVGRAETYQKCLDKAREYKLVKDSITGNGYTWAMDRGSRVAWVEMIYKDQSNAI